MSQQGQLAVVKESLTTAPHVTAAATVKDFLTVRFEGGATTEKSSVTAAVLFGISIAQLLWSSFPRRRESSLFRMVEGLIWIPAFAGMTHCGGCDGRLMRPALAP